MKDLFDGGQVVATQVAITCLGMEEIQNALYRHFHGDWGETLCDKDKNSNELAVASGEDYIFSAYNAGDIRYYVITEESRSATIVLLADEY